MSELLECTIKVHFYSPVLEYTSTVCVVLECTSKVKYYSSLPQDRISDLDISSKDTNLADKLNN